jgi:hypothetical protein
MGSAAMRVTTTNTAVVRGAPETYWSSGASPPDILSAAALTQAFAELCPEAEARERQAQPARLTALILAIVTLAGVSG